MKCAIIYIFLLMVVVSGYLLSRDEGEFMHFSDSGYIENPQHERPEIPDAFIIRGNCNAVLSLQQTLRINSSVFWRRINTGISLCGKIFTRPLACSMEFRVRTLLKNNLHLFLGNIASKQEQGYFIYSLCKIII